jgi:hypothetical protein
VVCLSKFLFRIPNDSSRDIHFDCPPLGADFYLER